MNTPQESVINVPFNEQKYVMWMHVSQLAGLIGVPSFLIPLVMWLMKKDVSTRVNETGKDILNFQISLLIGLLISFIAIFVFIGIFGFLIIFLVSIIFPIIAALKADKGQRYQYPSLTILK